MRWFRQQGWQVDYVSDGEIHIPDCDNQYAIPIKRNPYNLLYNIKAYKELKKILTQNDYDIIHCHTPVGGVLGRLAAKSMKLRAKIIYTAHGFHFYKGAPLVNWLIYYPVEKYLAQYTDVLITINDEDYKIAVNNFKTCKNIHKINGVGIDLKVFYRRNIIEKKQLKKKLGFNEEDYIITNVAEINKNKNQIMLIKALPKLRPHIHNLKVLFIGNYNYSNIKKKLDKLVRILKLQDTVRFLGYRDDIGELTAISNIGFSASIREGLPVNIIEAMACGIPVVCSSNRGHNSLIDNNASGLLFSDSKEMIECILKIYSSKLFSGTLSENASENSKKYERDLIISKMAEIYTQFMQD
jgi:glycosyltransferase EpsD